MFPCTVNIQAIVSFHVETCILLSKLKFFHIDVETEKIKEYAVLPRNTILESGKRK